MFETVDGFDTEMALQHGGSNALLETTHEDTSCELFLFLVLFGRVVGGRTPGCHEHGGVGRTHHRVRVHRVRVAHVWGHHGSAGVRCGVQLFHGFLLLKLLYIERESQLKAQNSLQSEHHLARTIHFCNKTFS